jgi:hypothetical protein
LSEHHCVIFANSGIETITNSNGIINRKNLNVSLEASETQSVRFDPINEDPAYSDIDSDSLSYQSVESDVMLNGVVVGTAEIITGGEPFSTSLSDLNEASQSNIQVNHCLCQSRQGPH